MPKRSAKLQEIQEMVSQYGDIIEQITDTEALRSIRSVFEGIEDQRYQPYVVSICKVKDLTNPARYPTIRA